jgi:hypothetical protein
MLGDGKAGGHEIAAQPQEAARPRDAVVMYFYVHSADEEYRYTSTRGKSEPAALTALYLECALVQTASLRLSGSRCDLLFVSNLHDPHDVSLLGRRGVRLVEAMESLGVVMRHADFAHRFENTPPLYGGARYVLDAIATATAAAPPEQVMWFTDLDCVWVDPDLVFAAAPPVGKVGCLLMDYPPDWDVMLGTTPMTVGRFGTRIGDCEVPIPWVGGELICGTAATLGELVAACDELEREIGERPDELPAEEHLFSLVAGVGRADLLDLSSVGRRLFTGRRHTGPKPDDPSALGIWHLPAEKGLSFRRTANEILAGRTQPLASDLRHGAAATKRFNVGKPSLARTIRDDAWVVATRLRAALPARRLVSRE